MVASSMHSTTTFDNHPLSRQILIYYYARCMTTTTTTMTMMYTIASSIVRFIIIWVKDGRFGNNIVFDPKSIRLSLTHTRTRS